MQLISLAVAGAVDVPFAFIHPLCHTLTLHNGKLIAPVMTFDYLLVAFKFPPLNFIIIIAVIRAHPLPERRMHVHVHMHINVTSCILKHICITTMQPNSYSFNIWYYDNISFFHRHALDSFVLIIMRKPCKVSALVNPYIITFNAKALWIRLPRRNAHMFEYGLRSNLQCQYFAIPSTWFTKMCTFPPL